MECSQYTISNNSDVYVEFNYRRCDDNLWLYQVELEPGETKNIWLIKDTFSIAPQFSQYVTIINNGDFPQISPTPIPSNTPIPSLTPTVTPTFTPTPTPTIVPPPNDFTYIFIPDNDFYYELL